MNDNDLGASDEVVVWVHDRDHTDTPFRYYITSAEKQTDESDPDRCTKCVAGGCVQQVRDYGSRTPNGEPIFIIVHDHNDSTA